MSIDMYVSASQRQAASTKRMIQQQLEGYQQMERAIGQFVFNSQMLTGAAYDSAKQHYSSVLLPLIKGGKLYSEAVARCVAKLPSDYQAKVDSGDLKESELEKKIAELDAKIREKREQQAHLRSLSLHLPSEERGRYNRSQKSLSNSIETLEKSKKKLKEKLQKLREFNISSVNIFAGLAGLQRNIAMGSKLATSSFNGQTFVKPSQTQLAWAEEINTRWNDRLIRLEKELYKKAKDWETLGMMGYFKKYPEEYTSEKKELLELIIAKNGNKFDMEAYMDVRKEGGYAFEIDDDDFIMLLLGANAKIINEEGYNRFLLQGGAADLKYGDSYFKVMHGKIDGTTGWGYGFNGVKFNTETSMANVKVTNTIGNEFISINPGVEGTVGKLDAKLNAYSDLNKKEFGGKISAIGYNVKGEVGGEVLSVGKNNTPLFGASGEISYGVQASIGYNNTQVKVQQLIPHVAIYSNTEELNLALVFGGKIKITYPSIGFN